MKDIKSHTRIIDSLTGKYEKPLLIWLAARQPVWVTPDTMTGLGVIGAIIIFLGYVLTNYHPAFLWLASFGFILNWYGDSLDGTLARYRDIQRPIFGFYIDHTIDAFNIVLLFLGIGFSPLVRFDLACVALVGYMLISVLVYIRTCVKGEFKISYGKLGATEARMIAIFVNTLVFFVGNPALNILGVSLTVFDLFAVVAIVLLFGMSISTTIVQARELSGIDSR